MKKFLFGLIALVAFSINGFAIESEVTTLAETSVKTEVKIVKINDVDRCYIKYCWYVGTKETCTEWQEIPCGNKGFKLETEPCKEETVAVTN